MNLFAQIVSGAGLMLGLAAYHAAAQPPPAPPDFDIVTRQAIQRSIPLIQNAAAGFSAKAKCVSCHNQSLPQMVVGVARLRGFSVDEKQAKAQDAQVYGMFLHMKPLMQTALQSPAAEKQLDVLMVDPAITMGYMLAGMGASGQKAEELTGLMAQYMTRKQDALGRWPVNTARPPMETSDFTATAQGVYALKTYSVSGPQTEARIAKARAWLLAAAPRNTEDKAFRLFGLHWAGAESAAITQATQDLLADQRDDGGMGTTARPDRRRVCYGRSPDRPARSGRTAGDRRGLSARQVLPAEHAGPGRLMVCSQAGAHGAAVCRGGLPV